MGERVTQAEYARRRGVSAARISQLVKDGRIARGDDGLVDVEATDANLDATLDQSKAHRDRQVAAASSAASNAAAGRGPTDELELDTPPPRAQHAGGAGEEARAPAGARAEAPRGDNAAADYWEHKAKREAAGAQLEELKLQERLGNLVDAEEVRRSRRETAQKIATALLQMPAQLAPVIAPGDPQACERLMLERIKKVLHELAADLETAPAGPEEARAA